MSDLLREPPPFVWFIEHVKATAVKNELERGGGQGRSEKVPRNKAAAQSVSVHLGVRSFDG
jgi:hypothetical protein